VASPPAHPGQHSREILESWGFPAAEVERLLASGAVVDA
jgi:crotonobetainyl-CoA:carnitine CoA-transferase CaiB-like acyl-CoA transferase